MTVDDVISIASRHDTAQNNFVQNVHHMKGFLEPLHNGKIVAVMEHKCKQTLQFILS